MAATGCDLAQGVTVTKCLVTIRADTAASASRRYLVRGSLRHGRLEGERFISAGGVRSLTLSESAVCIIHSTALSLHSPAGRPRSVTNRTG